MQPQDGALLFQVRADQSQIQKDVEAIKKQFEQMTRKAVEEGKKQADVWQTLLKGATAYFTLQGAQSFISQMVAVRSQFQQLEISFGTMLKSKEKANELMAQLTDLAAKTPFGLEEVSEGAKKLLAFQVPAEEVTETLRRMGDVASGLGVPMGQLIHVYGQVKAQGKLMTNDLYQFMNAGIPIIAELSKVVGKSETEIKDMVSAGKIGFAEIQAVIKNMTNEGGLFYNLMAEQSKSLGGQISNLKDNFDQMLNEIGKASEGIVSGAIKGVSFLVENYETIGKLIAGLIVSYGTYRAALIATAAVQQVVAARTAGMTVAEMAHYTWLVLVEKAQKLLNLTMLANPYALAAAALVGLVSYMVMFKKEATVAEQAQKAFNDEQERQKKVLEDERNEIEKLIEVVKDENAAKGQRINALNRLKDIYPDIFSKYKTEEELIRNIAKALKEVSNAQKEKDLKMDKDYIERLQVQKRGLQARLSGAANPVDIVNYKEQIQAIDIQIDKATKQHAWQSTLKRIDDIAELSADEQAKERKLMIEEYNRRHNAKQAKNQNLLREGEKQDLRKTTPFGFTGYENFSDADLGLIISKSNQLAEADKQRNKILDTRNELLAKQKELTSKISAIQSKEGQTQNDKDELKKLQEEKELVDKKLKGEYNVQNKKNTSKTIKNSLPEFDTEKAQRDHNRQIQDDLFAREESRIKIMQDGADKRLAIIQLEYDKQEEEIRRRSEDQLAAFIETEKQKAEAQGKWKKGKDFDTNTEAINAEKARLAENEKVLLADNAEYQRMQQEQVYKDLLEKYQTYTDQRKAIEEKYNADIAALQAKLGADAPQVKKAQDEKARELKKLDILYKKEGTAIAKLFDNLRKKTVKEIRQTIAEAESEIDELAKVLNMDDNANVEFITNLKQQLEQTRETAERSDTVFGKLGTNIKNLFKAKPNTAEWQEAFNGMLSSAQSITGQFGQLGQEFERLGQSTGNAALKSLGENMQKVSSILNKTLSFAQMGYSVGKGWGAAVGAFIGLFASGNEIANKAKLEHENRMLQISKSKLAIQESYNQALYQERLLQKENSSIFGTKELSNAIGYLQEYKKQWDEFKNSVNIRPAYSKEEIDFTIKQNKERWSSYYGNSINEKAKEWRKTLESAKISDLDNIGIVTGSHTKGWAWWKKTVTEWNSILKVYPELAKGVDGLDINLAKKLLEHQEFVGTGKEKLQEIVNAYERAQEAQKKFEEYTKNTFGELGNSIIDSVYNSLQKGENAFESFAKTVGNVIGKLGKQLAYELFVADHFKRLQERITEAAKRNRGSEDFARQSSQIVGEFGNAMKGKIGEMQQFLKDWNNMSSSMGFDFLNEKRQAVEKGFARMSQDSAEELNGQFRLQTQLSAEIKNAALQTANFIREMHQSMQTNAAQQLRHLAGIEANTYKLNKIETDIANMKAGINELTTKGIKIRT
ncbi:phage tail tape measure protein [Capnocytophaga sputigena]|uniref:Phage tail tape measure protein n=1 Tax=Capnocytophaga sputigena TaxID=1019 RepID=A0A250F2C7_CAPSP|nr:tape measure protein [Capnocytophaga sputigena]ATA79299.1 phage tail tape measure protein [Capnocytophaga sputigena]